MALSAHVYHTSDVALLLVPGIPPHVDTHSAFEDEITSLGLASQVLYAVNWLH